MQINIEGIVKLRSTTDVAVKGDEVEMPEPRGACQRMTILLVANATTKLNTKN